MCFPNPVFLFHKYNCLWMFFREMERISPVNSILKPSIPKKKNRITKKVRISDCLPSRYGVANKTKTSYLKQPCGLFFYYIFIILLFYYFIILFFYYLVKQYNNTCCFYFHMETADFPSLQSPNSLNYPFISCETILVNFKPPKKSGKRQY